VRVQRGACRTIVITGSLLACAICVTAEQPPGTGSSAAPADHAAVPATDCEPATLGSPYIPVDSWIYPAVMRLYSLGYVDSTFLGLRPWTRAGVMHMTEEAANLIEDGEASGDSGATEARAISESLNLELHFDMEGPCGPHEGGARAESVYTVARGITGTPLHDSYHLGQTIVNDYGRPFESGFNN